MTSDISCVFCRIINSQITARILHQNDHAVALLDAFPLSVGHTLVIPKIHYPKLQDMDFDSISSVFLLVKKICLALEKAVNIKSTTVAVHNGREAGQEIPHVHVHIVPRTKLDGAGPIHTMFKKRPALNANQLDLIYRDIKNVL